METICQSIMSVCRPTQVFCGCLQDWGQHIMHTEQAMRKASPVHATSPEHTLPEKPPISPARRMFSLPRSLAHDNSIALCWSCSVSPGWTCEGSRSSYVFCLQRAESRQWRDGVVDPSSESMVSDGMHA